MRKKELIEGILLLVISVISLAEGIRLTIYKDPHTLYDTLGPGPYVLVLSLILTATTAVHFFVNYGKVLSMEKAAIKKEMKGLMISMIVVFVIYIFLIGTIGYLVATSIFLFLEFRVIGIKSLITNVTLTLAITAAYYVVFIHYCQMPFPRGVVFR